MRLPNDVLIKDLVVIDSEIGSQSIGVLIGMDVIGMGDFAVSNFGDKTVFSFRIPSDKRTDYVAELRKSQLIGPTHGKGKKRKDVKWHLPSSVLTVRWETAFYSVIFPLSFPLTAFTTFYSILHQNRKSPENTRLF